MYKGFASPPRLVNTEQPTKQKTRCRACIWSFGLSEVYESEAAELAQLAPVTFLHVQAITITLD